MFFCYCHTFLSCRSLHMAESFSFWFIWVSPFLHFSFTSQVVLYSLLHPRPPSPTHSYLLLSAPPHTHAHSYLSSQDASHQWCLKFNILQYYLTCISQPNIIIHSLLKMFNLRDSYEVLLYLLSSFCGLFSLFIHFKSWSYQQTLLSLLLYSSGQYYLH